jgi:hypothetical protein
MLTGQELIRCVESMTQDERRELVILLGLTLDRQSQSDSYSGQLGVELNAVSRMGMTPEQREEYERGCLT